MYSVALSAFSLLVEQKNKAPRLFAIGVLCAFATGCASTSGQMPYPRWGSTTVTPEFQLSEQSAREQFVPATAAPRGNDLPWASNAPSGHYEYPPYHGEAAHDM